MDKNRLQRLSQPLTNVYLSIENTILINLAKRIRKFDNLLDTDIQSWQLQALNEIQPLTTQNIAFLASQTNNTAEQIRKTLEGAGYGALNEFEDELQEQAIKGKLNTGVPPIKESGSLLAVLEGYERQAKNSFNLVNTTMLDQSRQIYLDIINQTTGEVLAGVSTPRQALRKTARKWAETGVPALIDKRGRQWSTEAYVNMVTRSTSNNVANSMQTERFKEYGQDLVEISSHSGARPNCEPYQGRIYSSSGDSNKYPALSSTSIGEANGISGVNCGHVLYPYFEGTKRTYKPNDPETNDRVYKESQQQRYLERQIRHAKREQNMLDAMGDKEGAEIAKRKVLDRQANQREFIKRTNRTRRYEREQIV